MANITENTPLLKKYIINTDEEDSIKLNLDDNNNKFDDE